MTPVRYKVGQFFFFFWSVFLLIEKPKHLLQQKRAVEATKSNRLHSHHVEICFRKIRSQKDAACKTEAFLHTLFLENEVQTDQKYYGAMLLYCL